MSICPIRGHMLAAKNWLEVGSLASTLERLLGPTAPSRPHTTPTLERTMSKQTKPSIVFVHGIWTDGNKDRTVQPDIQRFAAKRMGPPVFETDTTHVPTLAPPPYTLDPTRHAPHPTTHPP